MAKFAVLFLAALAFQATFASLPGFYQEGKLVNYLDEIRTEVKDLTLFLEKDFPENHLAVKTVTWQCQRLIEAVEVIINKLHEETFTYHQDGHKVFKQVIHVLEEVCNSLKQVSLHHDITNVHELKEHFTVCIRTVYEHIENLVKLTYTYYPEFRYTLKYILVDFMTALHGIRSHFLHLNTEFHTEFQTVQTPKLLIKDIHEYTREFTEIFKEFTHPTQVKVALRGYLLYVNEIVHKLEGENVFGHKELDVVVHELCTKLREIVFPLMEIMNETTIDMKVFRTKIVTKCFEVVSIFEQLVQLCEDKVLPLEVREFLIKIIYHYCYAIKHVCYEVKFGYKVGFYMPKYYTPEYYGKHGYGLYEKEFHHRFFAPYTYETKYTIPHEFRSIEEPIFTPYKYETLFPEHNYYNEHLFGKSFGLNSYNKYFKGLKYDYETPQEFVNTIHMLVKRVFERFERNTFDTKNYQQVIIHEIREFLEVLEWICEKFESKVTFEHELYSEKLVKEVFFNLKQIKTELKEIVSTGVFTNIHEIKIRFLRYIEVVATELTKLFEKYEVPQFERVLIKDICIRFITFLHKVCYEPTSYSHEFFPVNEFTGYSQKYFKGMKYDYQTPKEFVNTIHMLVKRVFERFEHNTFETKNYEIHEFLEVLEWICEKFDKTVTFEHELYSDKLVKEAFFNLKQIKTELKEIVSTGVFTNIHEIKIRFLHYIEVVATELTKLFEKYEVPQFERVLIKDICIRFITFLHKVCYEPTTYSHEFFPVNEFTGYPHKYFKGMKYDYETPKEFVNTIHMLVKRVFERFEHNTFETKNYEQVIIYEIREFLEVLEWICEKFEKTVTFEHELYSDKLVKEVFFNLKQIKTELKEIVSTGVFTNIHEIKIRFLRYIEVVATELTKLFEKYEVPQFERVLIKDICIRFITFLHKVCYEPTTYSHEFFPVNEFTGYPHKYFKGMKYDYETPKEFVNTIHMLVKRVFERFEHNTFETKNYEQVIIYEIREFLEVLEWICEKFDKTVTFEHELYSDKLVKEVFFNLKQIKTELKEIVSTGVFTNIHEIKIRFLRYIEVVATELTKLFEKYEVPQFERVLIKDICIRFITFLHKVCYEPTTYSHEFFPVNEFTGYPHKYFKGMKYDYETPKEFVNTIHMLVKRVFERFEHNTFETKNYEQVIIYEIREFLEVLEWICEKFDKTVTFEHELYSDKLVKEVFFNLKQIKTELTEIISTGVFTNIHEIKIRFLRYIEVVATELTKLFEKYEVPQFERVLIKDICIRFITFLHKVCYEPTSYSHEFLPVNEFTGYPYKYFKGMKYGYETPKEFVNTIHMLMKRVFERFEHNTFETKNYEQVIIYEIREFLEVLEWICEKFEKTVTFEHELFSDKLVKEVFFNLKQIKTELKEIVSTGVFTNIHEIKIRFLRYIEVVATELTKLFEKYEVPQFERVLIKDICIRFITFLHKVCYEPTTYSHEFFPVNEFTGYFHKYFKDNTVRPYVFTRGLKY